jgi:hypothetical protein
LNELLPAALSFYNTCLRYLTSCRALADGPACYPGVPVRVWAAAPDAVVFAWAQVAAVSDAAEQALAPVALLAARARACAFDAVAPVLAIPALFAVFEIGDAEPGLYSAAALPALHFAAGGQVAHCAGSARA